MEFDMSSGVIEPQIFYKLIEPTDIQPGCLGNIWFLSAVAALAERPALIERLIQTKEYNEKGIYKVRLCKNGEWREVILDDYFPCYPNGGPMFAKSQGVEMWMLLIEKAYAKLHGGYKTLTGGSPHEALADLTGCPTTSFSFKDDKVKDMIESGKFWDLIKHFQEEGYIVQVAMPPQDMWTEHPDPRPGDNVGVLPGHSYSIVAAKEAKGQKLFQIRNPFGRFIWNGDWSYQSGMWNQETIQAFKPDMSGEDGTFWMSYQDLVFNFASLDVCRVRNWDEVRVRGRFLRYADSANATNEVVVSKWFYVVDVPTKSHLFLTLNQEDERIEGVLPRRPYIDAGLAVLKMDKEQGSELLFFKDFTIGRSANVELILEPGSYIVVPRTSGCSIRRPEGAEADTILLMDSVGTFHPLFISTIKDIFNKFDLNGNCAIELTEWKGFMEIIGQPQPKDMLDYKNTVMARFCSCAEGVTLRGFVDWWKKAMLEQGEPTIWSWLEKLGYDRDLYSVRSRNITLTFQSRGLEEAEPIEVRIRDSVCTDVENKTTEMILNSYGKVEAQGQGYRLVSLYSPGGMSFTYGISNEGDKAIEATLDMSSSENLQFSSKGPLVKKVVKAGETEFMMHAQAGYGNFTKVVRHSAKEVAGKS